MRLALRGGHAVPYPCRATFPPRIHGYICDSLLRATAVAIRHNPWTDGPAREEHPEPRRSETLPPFCVVGLPMLADDHSERTSIASKGIGAISQM